MSKFDLEQRLKKFANFIKKERQNFPLLIVILLFRFYISLRLVGKIDAESGKYSTPFTGEEESMSSVWAEPCHYQLHV